MDDLLEKQLKRALEREEPPAGFAERTLARILAAPQRTERVWWQQSWAFLFAGRPAWRVALAGGLAAMMLLGAGFVYRQRQERQRAEEARSELLTALQIASSELNRVREVVVLVRDQQRPPESPVR